MLILRRPFSSAKCGISQEMGSTASRVAWGRMNRLPPVVSSSTILVTVTSPICHCIVVLPCQAEHIDDARPMRGPPARDQARDQARVMGQGALGCRPFRRG